MAITQTLLKSFLQQQVQHVSLHCPYRNQAMKSLVSLRAQSTWAQPAVAVAVAATTTPPLPPIKGRPRRTQDLQGRYGNDSITARSTKKEGTSGDTMKRFLGQPQSFSHDKTTTTANNSVLPNKKKYDSDLIVVLDMDECLIHSQFFHQDDNDKIKNYAAQVKSPSSDGITTGDGVNTFTLTLPDDEGTLVKVHERPHLRDFLQKVTAKYETHIFTAANKLYAKPVLDMLDPTGTMFTKVWYRDSCQYHPDIGAYMKELKMLNKDHVGPYDHDSFLKRAVLVDNNPWSFLANPSNGILVNSFYNDPHDTTLNAVLDMLKVLDKQDDVRPLLNTRFGLHDALKEEMTILHRSQTQQSHPVQGQTGKGHCSIDLDSFTKDQKHRDEINITAASSA